MIRFALFFLFGLIFGCAAHGPNYVELMGRIEQPPDHVARVVFFRTRDSALYIARKATISVDGEKVGATAYGGFHYRDLSQGAHSLRADMWDAPGECELKLKAVAGQTYYFQVDPRNESFGSFAAGDFVATMITNGTLSGLPGLAAGVGASAAESSGKDCGGAFRLYPVDPATANSRLVDLNLSE